MDPILTNIAYDMMSQKFGIRQAPQSGALYQ